MIFVILSQMNCFYCNSVPLNLTTEPVSKQSFFYNGLDRINSSIGYYINNILPCCKNCNWMKHVRSINDFNEWITIIYNRLPIIRNKSFC